MIGRLSRMIEAAAAAVDVTPAEIVGPRRTRRLVRARHAVIIVAREERYTQRTLAEALNRSIDGVRYAERRAA